MMYVEVTPASFLMIFRMGYRSVKEYFTANEDCVKIMRQNTTLNDTMVVMDMLGKHLWTVGRERNQ